MTTVAGVEMIAGTTDFVVIGINSFLVTEEDVIFLERMMIAEDAVAAETTSEEQKTVTEAAMAEEMT
ncbi:hypothetical protein [Rossellomorea arthrocnemi]|uniref:hypothetical protein n=1 Tax=Rossellomorea arthrocnemi TaxID=2769542 RepID=UPI00191A2BC8|nr:hypothetical protein [Rossellomorea arthrocnemi]